MGLRLPSAMTTSVPGMKLLAAAIEATSIAVLVHSTAVSILSATSPVLSAALVMSPAYLAAFAAIRPALAGVRYQPGLRAPARNCVWARARLPVPVRAQRRGRWPWSFDLMCAENGSGGEADVSRHSYRLPAFPSLQESACR
ncbi:hypothetical protein ALMP_37650 [Streptomyces sp. A012304]|nr:hypothetical protein ALMP_37650 [Streptomyces sp. A012304]